MIALQHYYLIVLFILLCIDTVATLYDFTNYDNSWDNFYGVLLGIVLVTWVGYDLFHYTSKSISLLLIMFILFLISTFNSLMKFTKGKGRYFFPFIIQGIMLLWTGVLLFS